LAQQAAQRAAAFLVGARVGKHIGPRVGLHLAIGQQPRIGGDCRAAKLQHQMPVEIEPQRLVGRFTHRVRHECRVRTAMMC
jgi:hypothetical protein